MIKFQYVCRDFCDKDVEKKGNSGFIFVCIDMEH